MVRVVLAEDEGSTRDAYALLLEHFHFDVVACAEDGRQAVREIERRKPDVAVLDVEMRGTSGIDALRMLRARKISTPVILLTTFDNSERYAEGLREGMHGWILKGEDSEDLEAAITMVADGKTRLVPPSDDDDDDVTPLPALVVDLTPRETEVIRLVHRGMSNRTIARSFGTKVGTVKNQVSSIIQKLDAVSRWDAVRIAALRRIL